MFVPITLVNKDTKIFTKPKILVKQINKIMHLYILTDCNRNNFKTGYVSSKEELENLFGKSKLNSLAREGSWRVVYFKEYHTNINAQLALRELNFYTRMQIERLIRKSNPNWINLLEKTSYLNNFTNLEQSSNQMIQI